MTGPVSPPDKTPARTPPTEPPRQQPGQRRGAQHRRGGLVERLVQAQPGLALVRVELPQPAPGARKWQAPGFAPVAPRPPAHPGGAGGPPCSRRATGALGATLAGRSGRMSSKPPWPSTVCGVSGPTLINCASVSSAGPALIGSDKAGSAIALRVCGALTIW